MAGAFALDGIRVIDFGQYIAGPMAAMLLADFGADVIRVDPPDGPRFKTSANATWNRGKRSIALNLKDQSDLETARQLIASADVVIENFRPGVMDRLGLGPAAMTEMNSRLVYCSLPGFASDDPRAGLPAWEGLLGAATGLFSSHASIKTDVPVYTAIPYASDFGALLAVTSITMALHAREFSGLGQAIEVPLFNATFNAFSGKVMKVHDAVEVDVASKWEHMRCKDGRWFMYLPNRFNKHLLALPEMAQWRDPALTPEQLLKPIAELFLTRTTSEWEDLCANVGLEGIASNPGVDWLHHPLAEATRIVADFDDPELGRFRGMDINLRLSKTPGAVRAPRARLDAHRAEILKELETRSAAPSGSTHAAGNHTDALHSALEGIKVLDLGIILASPSCGRTLAEFGANVVKIDSAHRNPVNWHNDVNRAKRSIVLDLKTQEGLDIFWRLLEDADVVLENFRKGVADKLGIGYEACRARRPGIIYCSVNAYGRIGPFADRPGREVLAQAIAGMSYRLGSEKPVLNPLNGNDYGTGLMTCYGIAMALLHRKRNGEGQFVDSALIYTATLLQTNMLQDFKGKQWNEPHGQECRGIGALYRCYQASDAWLFIAAKPEQLAHCSELADIAEKTGTDLEQALEQRFRSQSVENWVAALTRAGITTHRVIMKFMDHMDNPVVRAQGLSLTREHDELGLVTTAGPGIKLSRTPIKAGRPAPKPGSDAASILGDIGMAHELDRLVREKVVVVDGILPGGAS